MKLLYGTTDLTEAELIRAHLRDAGIESSLDNQHGAFSAIGLPTSASPLGIYVRDEDAAEAAEILALHFEKKEEDGEPDPDAPPPLSPEESAQFEEKVSNGKPWRRFLIGFFILIPIASGAVCLPLGGSWEAGAFMGLSFVALLAAGWFIHATAGRGLKRKKPAS